MCVDAQGMLWIALWGGAKVIQVDPKNGERLAEVLVEGARQTTSCALGGPKLSTLFITSAREHLSSEALASQPLAGCLFKAETGVAGLPSNPYRPS
jgi:sugar lactone lactonase YvrE